MLKLAEMASLPTLSKKARKSVAAWRYQSKLPGISGARIVSIEEVD